MVVMHNYLFLIILSTKLFQFNEFLMLSPPFRIRLQQNSYLNVSSTYYRSENYLPEIHVLLLAETQVRVAQSIVLMCQKFKSCYFPLIFPFLMQKYTTDSNFSFLGEDLDMDQGIFVFTK